MSHSIWGKRNFPPVIVHIFTPSPFLTQKIVEEMEKLFELSRLNDRLTERLQKSGMGGPPHHSSQSQKSSWTLSRCGNGQPAAWQVHVIKNGHKQNKEKMIFIYHRKYKIWCDENACMTIRLYIAVVEYAAVCLHPPPPPLPSPTFSSNLCGTRPLHRPPPPLHHLN